MSRATSWEDDEPYPNASALFQANVDRALKGKKGQTFLREIESALLAMPEKKLIGSAVCEGGQVCLLGAVAVERAVKNGKSRADALAELEKEAKEHGQYEPEGVNWDEADDETLEYLRSLLGIKQFPLAWTFVHENDECHVRTPEERYERMLKWVQRNIKGEEI